MACGINGCSSGANAINPIGAGQSSCCSQASACCQKGLAASQNGGDMTQILQELSRLAKLDPNAVAQALKQNPAFAQVLGGAV